MTKYREYFLKMIEENQEVFDDFKKIHDKYEKDTSSHQTEYNTAGKPIIEIVREYEDRLCSRSEGSGYGSFTGNLAEKFWTEVRREYPMIDRIGIIVKKAPVQKSEEDPFEIKKINLTT